MYAVIPVVLLKGERGTIHVLFESPARFVPLDHPDRVFALGLFFIGLMAGLVFIFISLIITGRLKKLRQSALTISEGNLSHRAAIRGQDEIGELAQSFNQMADKLEAMIVNARELTANVSHELRTPLTRIRISEEILREKLKPGMSPFTKDTSMRYGKILRSWINSSAESWNGPNWICRHHRFFSPSWTQRSLWGSSFNGFSR